MKKENPCKGCEYSPEEYYAPHVCKTCEHWEKSYYYREKNKVVSMEDHIKKRRKAEEQEIISEILKQASELNW